MKFLMISCLVALAAADVSHVVGQDAAAQILKQASDISPDGAFNYVYETSNGIAADAQGLVKGAGEEAAVAIQGQFRWASPEGEQVAIQYVADENGYQPQGAALPTPHPIPEAIQRSLEYNLAHPSEESKPRNPIPAGVLAALG